MIIIIYLLMIYKFIYLYNNYSKRVVTVSVVKRTKRYDVSQLNGNINKQTTTIQNPTTIQRVSQIQFLSKHQRPIQNPNPTLPRLQSDQGFCSPANHGVHLFPITCCKDRDRTGMQYHRAEPRPTRVVTIYSPQCYSNITLLLSLHLIYPCASAFSLSLSLALSHTHIH